MLKKIIAFFRNYLQWFFPKEAEEEPIIIRDPDPEDAKPQDGSDIPTDSTTVEIITDLEAVETEAIPPVEVPTEAPTFPPPTTIPTRPEPPINNSSRYLWCLDNGHGRLTAGKRSPKLKTGERLYEYEFNRDIVKKIIPQLEAQGIAYYEVVPEIEVDNFLQGRVLRANNHPSQLKKIFVSVHSNAGPAPPGKWTSVHGIETWFFHGSRTSKKIAAIFQKHLIKKTNWFDRGIKSQTTKQFYVLRNTNMPAILTENGFFNNETQVYDLMKPAIRQKIADAHVAAILEIEAKGL